MRFLEDELPIGPFVTVGHYGNVVIGMNQSKTKPTLAQRNLGGWLFTALDTDEYDGRAAMIVSMEDARTILRGLQEIVTPAKETGNE